MWYEFTLLYFILCMFYWLSYYGCPNFSPLASLHLGTHLPSSNPPTQFMPMGHTCKFFGFSISYAILNIPVYFVPTVYASKIQNVSWIHVSSLRREHVNLLCIFPILVFVPPKRAPCDMILKVPASSEYLPIDLSKVLGCLEVCLVFSVRWH